ncbi:MAG TPA: N-acetylmuramoyl-L-alanine amidase [Candidatus Acidoferrales bacterium]|nr:N-acetylmuramoyl-L-alanine amidase [Candidatus Acidoferrales bacterium]
MACAFVALALLVLAGCAHRISPPATIAPPPAPAAPARPRPAPGYAGLRDSLGSADARVLRGKRIVLDPGHGGFFTGSLGVNGLTEAEVNLAVALDLDTLLEAQGAQVLLTRERDRDFLTPRDSTLRSDLAERVRMANAFAPDLFLSIHHNADPAGAHDVNETQTYYKLGDDGPSYDAATDVHRALVRNLGIETQRLLPGNFAVVRGVDAPAILTEASYLTDPDVEARLRTPEARRLEAEALDLGLAHYFARRAPVVDSVWAEGTSDDDGREAAPRHWAVHARIRGAYDLADVRVDGLALPVTMNGSVLVANAPPLTIGRHEATVSARLAGEGSARTRRFSFDVRKSAHAELRAAVVNTPVTPSRAAIPVRIELLDVDGLPWPDSTRVHVRALTPAALKPRDTTVVMRDGVGWAYFHLRGRGRTSTPVRWRISVGDRSADAGPLTLETRGPGAGFDAPGERTGFALAMPSGERLQHAPGTTGPAPRVTWLNRDGFVGIAASAAGAFVAPQLAGFRAWGADTTWPPRFVAIADGALAGHRIAIDPEGGGDDAAGTGPSGTRAASLNLEVARALAAMLEASGAQVLLTRQGDAAVSEVERVQRSEGFGAERYLRIGHAAARPVAGHYFSSGAGRRWALSLGSIAVELGLADSLPASEVAKYAITQASSIALYASLARIDSAASEARLLSPGVLRTEAYALYLSLAHEFGAAPAGAPDTLAVRDADGRAVPGALVTLGGTLVLQTGADGRALWVRTEPGPIEAAAGDWRVNARALLLDSERSHFLTETR